MPSHAFLRNPRCAASLVNPKRESSRSCGAQKTLFGCCGRSHAGWYDQRTRRVRDLACGDTNVYLWVTRTPATLAPPAALTHRSAAERYIDGVHLGSAMERYIDADDWTSFEASFRGWFAFLLNEGACGAKASNLLETEVAVEYLDCIPRNIIVRGLHFHYIDREWAFSHKLLAGTVVLRFLVSLYGDDQSREFLARNLGTMARQKVLSSLLKHFGMEATQHVIENYVTVTNAIIFVVYPEKIPVQHGDVWALVCSDAQFGEPRGPWYEGIYRQFRNRFVQSAVHVAKAARVWWV